MRADSFVNLRCVSLDPSPHCRMIHGKSALPHHLFQVSIRKLIAAVPAHTQENEWRLEVTLLKRRGVACHVSDLNGEKLVEQGEYISKTIAATLPKKVHRTYTSAPRFPSICPLL